MVAANGNHLYFSPFSFPLKKLCPTLSHRAEIIYVGIYYFVGAAEPGVLTQIFLLDKSK